jgi:putative glutamine amidotransferase
MKIGLTYTGMEWKHDNYVRWLKGMDADVEVVRLSAADDNQQDLLTCNGLVLSGGIDIHPVFYGGDGNYVKAPAGGWEKARDDFEYSVLQLAWAKEMPVLGVCRGLQLINVSLGGTLVQDLGAAGDEVHENVAGVDKQHPVSVSAGSLLGEIAGKEGGIVNSAHHQAVHELAGFLRVNCRAEDGTIEGIEWADPVKKSFLLGVQWHPERMYTNGLADDFLYTAIRDRFIKEIKNNIQRHADH